MTKQELLTAIEKTSARSAWTRGVKTYAYALIERFAGDGDFDGDFDEITERDLLDGTSDWYQYSRWGNAFCYDKDIAAALCTPWELKRTKNGTLPPNRHEEWLDVQGRALFQAAQLILSIIHG